MELNEYYFSLLEPKQLEIFKTETEWGDPEITIQTIPEIDHVVTLIHNSYDDDVAEPYIITCCGISELKFGFVHNCGSRTENKPYFDELIAKVIDSQILFKDGRILITGLPIHCPSGTYNESFYQKIHKTLLSFGMTQLNKEPYINKNSGNSIVVLVGKAPQQ